MKREIVGRIANQSTTFARIRMVSVFIVNLCFQINPAFTGCEPLFSVVGAFDIQCTVVVTVGRKCPFCPHAPVDVIL